MPAEKRLVRKILQHLKAQGGFWFKVVGGPFQMAGLPDIIGCYQGRFVGLEAKTAKGRPTKLQKTVIGFIQDAGGIAGVVRSIQDVEDLLLPLRASDDS